MANDGRSGGFPAVENEIGSVSYCGTVDFHWLGSKLPLTPTQLCVSLPLPLTFPPKNHRFFPNIRRWISNLDISFEFPILRFFLNYFFRLGYTFDLGLCFLGF